MVSVRWAPSRPSVPRARPARRSISLRASTGASPAQARNGSRTRASGQASAASTASTESGITTRDDGRGDGVGVEILHRLHVLGRQRHQVAGAAAQQVGGGEAVQLGEQGDPHLGQQAVGHVVREPGFQPVQRGRRRARPAAAPRAGPWSGGRSRTAATASAPSTLTPMKPATRPTPQSTVSASLPRQGRMTREQAAQGGGPADLRGVLVQRPVRRGRRTPAPVARGAAAAGRAPPAPSCGPIRRR